MFFIQRFGVYHWESFEFEDNTKKDKYFIELIIINKPLFYALRLISE